jgi:hypothetical protein
VSTRIGSCSGTIPVSIPIACFVDRFDEGVELLIARGIGIQPRLSKDLGSRQQPTPFGTHARQVAGATLLGVSPPAAALERSLCHLCSLHQEQAERLRGTPKAVASDARRSKEASTCTGPDGSEGADLFLDPRRSATPSPPMSIPRRPR